MLRGLERERENRNLRLRIGGLNDIIDRERERAGERVEENRILRLRVAHSRFFFSLKEMTSSAAFRMAPGEAAWADARCQPCGRSDGPATSRAGSGARVSAAQAAGYDLGERNLAELQMVREHAALFEEEGNRETWRRKELERRVEILEEENRNLRRRTH